MSSKLPAKWVFLRPQQALMLVIQGRITRVISILILRPGQKRAKGVTPFRNIKGATITTLSKDVKDLASDSQRAVSLLCSELPMAADISPPLPWFHPCPRHTKTSDSICTANFLFYLFNFDVHSKAEPLPRRLTT